MGTRVSRQDVKVPHFYFGEVSRRNEFGKEIITVSKQMVRRDEYDEWVKKYQEAKSYNQESLLLPESCEIEEIKKYMACCECPADYEMSVPVGPCSSVLKNSTTSTTPSWSSARSRASSTRSRSSSSSSSSFSPASRTSSWVGGDWGTSGLRKW